MVRTGRQRIYCRWKHEKRSNYRKEENQRKFEMWQKSLELEKEAKDLKQKASGGVKKK